eukprot:s540_g12.t1
MNKSEWDLNGPQLPVKQKKRPRPTLGDDSTNGRLTADLFSQGDHASCSSITCTAPPRGAAFCPRPRGGLHSVPMRGFTVPTVYFQKYVAIENPRLWGLYCCIYITLVALVAAAIALFQVYLVPVDPHLRLQLWKDVGALTGSSCPSGSYDYDPGNGLAVGEFFS